MLRPRESTDVGVANLAGFVLETWQNGSQGYHLGGKGEECEEEHVTCMKMWLKKHFGISFAPVQRLKIPVCYCYGFQSP